MNLSRIEVGSIFTICIALLMGFKAYGAFETMVNENKEDIEELVSWKQSFVKEIEEKRDEVLVKIKEEFSASKTGFDTYVSDRIIAHDVDHSASLDKVDLDAFKGVIKILGVRSFTVLSVDHKHSLPGTYFNFNKDNLDKILGSKKWSNKKFSVLNLRTGKEARVQFYRYVNGGTNGDGHGRWDDVSYEKNSEGRRFFPEEIDNWKVGDIVFIVSTRSLSN